MTKSKFILIELNSRISHPENPFSYGENVEENMIKAWKDVDFLEDVKKDFEYDLEHHVKVDFPEDEEGYLEAIEELSNRIEELKELYKL